MSISWEHLQKILGYGSMFWQGLLVTVLLSLLTVLIGFVLAFALAMMHLSKPRILRLVSGEIGRAHV